MNKTAKWIFLGIMGAIFAVLIGLVIYLMWPQEGARDTSQSGSSTASSTSQSQPASGVSSTTGDASQTDYEPTEEEKVMVEITMQDGGVMKLELYNDLAPVTVNNFVGLAKRGFYDGLTFHRIISGFMVQGGDPEGTGLGGSGEPITGEFASNGYENPLKHTRGVISMARQGNDMDSATSQFFIVHQDYPSLDGEYAAFGRVVEGLDVLDKIAATEVGADGQTPANPPVIESIRVIE